ncbi:MAG: serine hydrolase [Lachnospiraceae bacterium]|nr:serine hydrolase [Lachnospiraceae bacterium]
MNFDAFAGDIQQNRWNVYGAEVYEDGILTHSFGDTTENLHEIYSATKTILSIAVGIATDENRFDISRPIIDYLPADRTAKLSDEQKWVFQKLPVQRFLTMSVGELPFRPEGDSYLDFSLNTPLPHPEDKVFCYSNISAYLVGVALTQALGTDLGGFIEERIFEPLGITRFEYGRCPDGYFYGASAMKLTVHDLSRIGLLLYHKGMFEGKRILSEAYVKEATSIQQMNREGGYGYYIWKYRDGFSINGKWKQKCYVLPDRGLMVTYLSHIEDDSHDLLESMEKHILELL